MRQGLEEIIQKGDENGNHMTVRFRFPSGLEIWGLPTENFYGGTWDLGPTWNYLVFDDPPFLVDTGKSGMGLELLEMVNTAGVSNKSLGFVLLSHGHEDHDGGLPEIINQTPLNIKAHWIYDRLIRFYPNKGPVDHRINFPATCWRCFMPETFSNEHCLSYQRERSRLEIDMIKEEGMNIAGKTKVYHAPGHSPDSIVLVVNDEAVIVGDVVLPDITPAPTTEALFGDTESILKPRLKNGDAVYGLRAYIKTLNKISALDTGGMDPTVLPAHRLFYNGQWNFIALKERINELIQHHIDRCEDIINILKDGTKTAREIAAAHFEASLLEGMGIYMAENEINSHCELLSASGDVRLLRDSRIEATGETNFESLIRSFESEKYDHDRVDPKLGLRRTCNNTSI